MEKRKAKMGSNRAAALQFSDFRFLFFAPAEQAFRVETAGTAKLVVRIGINITIPPPGGYAR
jgi:hypothetical protein